MGYAFGRELEAVDRPALAEILDEWKAENGRLQDLIRLIVQSKPFVRNGSLRPVFSRNIGPVMAVCAGLQRFLIALARLSCSESLVANFLRSACWAHKKA